MGLFTKSIGPVFLKKSNQATEYIDKLKALQEKCPGELKEEIEKQITIAEYGVKGEESIAFELKNSGTAENCIKHVEIRILRGGCNQGNLTVFDML